ncbi:MAG: hypothetical protein HQK54_14440 [Oligoflexales bacterium]|nr:hypothetical protein [Oligoflexales bacterium]
MRKRNYYIAIVIAAAVAVAIFAVREKRRQPAEPGTSEDRDLAGSGQAAFDMPVVETGTSRKTEDSAFQAAASGVSASGGGQVQADGLKDGVILEAAWGAAPGQLGRSPARESNPEDPMSFAAMRNGGICILDQVNDRVQCFGPHGRLDRQFKLERPTAQDISIGADGKIGMLDRLGEPSLVIHSESGEKISEIPLVGGPITEGGTLTALLRDGEGNYYVEREHQDVIRIADSGGAADSQRPIFPGRPTRDGKLFVSASIKSARDGTIILKAFDRMKQLKWEKLLGTRSSVMQILMLESDKNGNIYVGALVGKLENPEESVIQAVRLNGENGEISGTIFLPSPKDPHERFRDLVVAEDGTLLHFESQEKGAEIRRYSF